MSENVYRDTRWSGIIYLLRENEKIILIIISKLRSGPSTVLRAPRRRRGRKTHKRTVRLENREENGVKRMFSWTDPVGRLAGKQRGLNCGGPASLLQLQCVVIVSFHRRPTKTTKNDSAVSVDFRTPITTTTTTTTITTTATTTTVTTVAVTYD